MEGGGFGGMGGVDNERWAEAGGSKSYLQYTHTQEGGDGGEKGE